MLRRGLCLTFAMFAAFSIARANEWPLVTSVERQPLVESTRRLIDALNHIGSPLADRDLQTLQKAFDDANSDVPAVVQKVLDPYCLALVNIEANNQLQVQRGPAQAELMQQGWRMFLVKVRNLAGATDELRAESPNALPSVKRGTSTSKPSEEPDRVTMEEIEQRFLDLSMFNSEPLRQKLSGLPLEYRIIQIYSRDVGSRDANLTFALSKGRSSSMSGNSLPVKFDTRPAYEIRLNVKDQDEQPTTAAFVIKDQLGRVYPNPTKRLAPDFYFHEQVYRADGETLLLPAGEFTAVVTQGPESLPQTYRFKVGPGQPQILDVELKRWINPLKLGWYSGDHHIHAAGCAHYDTPTEGVTAQDMMRHVLGEGLNVGCVLSWGPCWYTQKKNFDGNVSQLSQPNHVMRYDIEISGFPSAHTGHVCLLRLKEDDYPGTKSIEDWPSWSLPILNWAKSQGAVTGTAHSGWGLALPDFGPNGERLTPARYGRRAPVENREATEIPDYAMPLFDGIGANEFIVTVAHDAIDFMATVDTCAIWEMNMWYHVLNCGMTTRISGETDFPCNTDQRVGLGRVYVKMKPGEPLTFDNWVAGIKNGRSYTGDGRSHLFDFKVDDVAMGEPGSGGVINQLDIDQPRKVKVTVSPSAWLQPEITADTEAIRKRRFDEKPNWHIERCRIGQSRSVPVEIVMNGRVVAKKEFVADGTVKPMEFEIDVPHSSWIAARIFPSCHTNPVFVHVAGKPIRTSRKSAEWCRDAVGACWEAKSEKIRDSEKADARAAYDQAKAVYAERMKEAAGE